MTRGFGRYLCRNTIALLALFLALGGTSYAAATLISGSQIKPHTIAKNRLTNKAIKQLKGNRGPRGLQGPAGAPGAAGARGATGPAGPFPQGNLPSGNTLKGSYTAYNNNSAACEYTAADVSFPFQMAAALTGVWVPVGGSGAPHCNGAPANPIADPGYLCAYESIFANTNPGGYSLILQPETGSYGTSGRWGATLFIQAVNAGNTYSIGTWAATPPPGSAAASGHTLSHSPTTR